ncbi:myosin tail [Cladochytrium replicatum]|nr:myosin tail [Cladochytrium replicatum]
MNEQYSDASKTKADLARSVYALDQQTTELRDLLDEYQETARVAGEKLRRAEQQAAEAQNELFKEKNLTIETERAKNGLEKQVKELNARIVDLESNALADNKGATRRLESRLEELSSQIEAEIKEKNEAVKNARKAERLIRELQFQLQERDKQKSRFDEETEKMEQRLKRMKTQIEEMESSESNLQLAKRRAEREAGELKERATRFEKECEKLKQRLERGVLSPL